MTPIAEPQVACDRWWQIEVNVDAAPALGEDEVHVWASSISCNEGQYRHLSQLLSSDETERAGRFRFAFDRSTWTVSRALLRLLLARYVNVDPLSVVFEIGPFGKPEVRTTGRRLDFSASASFDQAVWAFSRAGSVGVDIERLDPVGARDLAEWLPPPDDGGIAIGTDRDPARAALEDWTRREAILKADGRGLSGETVDGIASSARFIAPGNLAAKWRVHRLDPVEGYVAAASIPPGVRRIRLFRWNPGAAIAMLTRTAP